jgi:hypothetical protein
LDPTWPLDALGKFPTGEIPDGKFPTAGELK